MDSFCPSCGTAIPLTFSACPTCTTPAPHTPDLPEQAPQGEGQPTTSPALDAPAPVGQPGYGPVAGYGPSPTSAVGQIANIGPRIGGWLLDFVLLAVLSKVITLPIGLVSADQSLSGLAGLYTLGFLAGLGCFIAYFVAPTALWGQTLGKLIVGTKVVSEADGTLPGWGKASARYAIMYLLNLPCYLPTLINACTMGSDAQNRGWHDRVANTVVIRTR